MNDFLTQLQQQNQTGIPLWVWGVVVVIVIIVAVVWTLREESEAGQEPAPQAPTDPAATKDAAAAPDVPAAPDQAEQVEVAEAPAAPEPAVASKPQPKTRPDNLKRVKGIGPKIEKLLKDNGITTFAQLAQTEVSRLQALLDEAEYALADPASWPEQAQQLAAGKG